MKCHEINYILDTWAPGQLHAGQKEAVDQHFASCRACREAWAAYREVSALRIPEARQGLRARIMAEVAAKEARAIPRSLILGGLLAVGVALAAAVALRVADTTSEVAQHLEEPAPIAPAGSPATLERVPGSTLRVDVGGGTETPSEASDSSSRTGYALDPNTIVVVLVPHPELDPERAALFVRFHEEILRRLREVPGLNVVRPELVDPFLRSGIPEEEVARNLGAGHLVVISTTPEPSASLTVTPVDMTTGAATGKMGGAGPFDARWPAQLESDAADVADFIKEGLTPFTPAQRQSAIADAQAIVLNAALPAAERVEALGKLSRRSPEARTDAVVAAAVELATIAPELRAYIWQAMYDVDNPYLIEPLLDSLAYDAADHRRRAAADALGTFVAEPRVKAALEQAQASDPSAVVRQAAQRALLTDEERDQLVLQTLLDETLPDRERLGATMLLTGLHAHEVPLTDEAAWAVFDMGATSTDPGVRSMAWGKLGRSGVDDPGFTGVLLDDLANHPSDSVRGSAANVLKQYTDDSTVRAALEQAESDSSFEVRRAARRALGKVPD